MMGKAVIIGKQCRGFILLSTLLAFAVVLFGTARATPPSMLVYLVDIDGLSSVVAEHFNPDISARLRHDLEARADAAPPLINPFQDRFTALARVPTAGIVFAEIWRSTENGDDRAKRFPSFLGAVNEAGPVRAIVSSPDYGGCVAVELSFEQSFERPALLERLSAFGFPGCSQRIPGRSFELSTTFWL